MRVMRDVKIVLLLTFFFLSACGLRNVSKPEWRLLDIQIDQLNRSKASVQIVAQIKNPNAFSVTVRQVHYRLYLKESLIAEGEKNEPFDLPRLGKAQVALPLEISVTEARQVMPHLKTTPRKEVAWRLEGECTVEAFGIEKVFPFLKEGGKKKSPEEKAEPPIGPPDSEEQP